MQQIPFYELIGFGPNGWGLALLQATGMTLAVAVCGFLAGALIGTAVAWAKLSRSLIASGLADGYTTVLRGIYLDLPVDRDGLERRQSRAAFVPASRRLRF